MKKILAILTVFILLAGCSGSPKIEPTPESTPVVQVNPLLEPTTLSVLSPSGAPALSLLNLIQSSPEQITIVDGAEPLQAAFVNPNPEYDVLLAPINLGVKLGLAGKTEYELAAVITWGNLFILGTEGVLQDPTKKIAVFGEGAVPGAIFNDLIEPLGILAEIVYYPSVTEAQAALLSNKADAAMIAEPAATATIAKAKEMGKELLVIADVQASWKEKYGSVGYAQAGVFVLKSSNQNKSADVQTLLDNIAQTIVNGNDPEKNAELVEAINAIGPQTIGVPSAELIGKTYSKLNLDYMPANMVTKQLNEIMFLFGIIVD